MKKATQQLVAFGFGVLFITSILILAICFPQPSQFQYLVFRSVLALAAAGAAAMIPGFLAVGIKSGIRAGGAIAVFVIVYFFSPAKLVANPSEVMPANEPIGEVELTVTAVLQTDPVLWSNWLQVLDEENPRYKAPDAYSANVVAYHTYIDSNRTNTELTQAVPLTNAPARLPPDFHTLLAADKIPTSLTSILTNQSAHLIVQSGDARLGEFLINQFGKLNGPGKMHYLPPLGDQEAPLKTFPIHNNSTNWAISLDYVFVFQITNASSVPFPLALPDLASKKCELQLLNPVMPMFPGAMFTNITFNFGRSLVVIKSGATYYTPFREGALWYPMLLGKGKPPIRQPGFGASAPFHFEVFQFPDRDSIFQRND